MQLSPWDHQLPPQDYHYILVADITSTDIVVKLQG